jgi:hypothetical protein
MIRSRFPSLHPCCALVLLGVVCVANLRASDCSTLNLTSIFRSGNSLGVYDEFASSVAANDSLMVVGARADGRFPAGALHVYVRDGLSWGGHQRLRFESGTTENFLGDAVAVDGETIIAGLRTPSSAYVFRRDGTNWFQQQKIIPSDATGHFGFALAVGGDTLVIGAPGDQINIGAAYVFRREGATWVETAKLRANDGQSWDAFGYSVAVDGDRIVVGSARHGGGTEAGIGHVFRREPSGWVEEARLFPQNRQLVGIGGIAVAISDQNAAINWPGFPKRVHLFRRTNNVWSATQTLTATNTKTENGFGISLQMVGNRLAIGSPAITVNGGLVGKVYLFTLNEDRWLFHQAIDSVPSYTEQYFGLVLSLYPEGLLVGAHGYSSGADRSATAFAYEFDVEPPTIESVEATPNVVWPPNGKMVPVAVAVSASDSCGAVTCRISKVTSNRPLNSSDWQITGDLTLNVRATRNEDGTPRLYILTIECRDVRGHSTTGDVIVTVPHDMRNSRGKSLLSR